MAKEDYMSHAYRRAAMRLLVFAITLAGLVLVIKPQSVLASTCTQCVDQCSHDRILCVRQCIASGAEGCDEACNPFGTTCTQDCTDAGLCP
jgi:hypothetical protein